MIKNICRFFKDYVNHQNLHLVIRRQRQIGIRDRTKEVDQQQTGRGVLLCGFSEINTHKHLYVYVWCVVSVPGTWIYKTSWLGQ